MLAMAASTHAAPLPADRRCKACSAHGCSNAYSWYIEPNDPNGQDCYCSCCGRCTPNDAYSPRPLFCDTWSLDSGSTGSTGSSYGTYSYSPVLPTAPYGSSYDGPIGSPSTAPSYVYTPAVRSAAAAATATASCKSTCRTFCAATYDCKKCSSTKLAAPCSKGCAKCKAGK